jgi:hypothetical protein
MKFFLADVANCGVCEVWSTKRNKKLSVAVVEFKACRVENLHGCVKCV